MVEFGNEIDPELNDRVITLGSAVCEQHWHGVLDVVPTYCSMTIHVDALCMDLDTLKNRLQRLFHTVFPVRTSSGAQHTIPVLYGGEWGPDLEEVASFAHMSVPDAIRLHAPSPQKPDGIPTS